MDSSASADMGYVILDTDMGTDDAWALRMLLQAERSRNIKVLALTCLYGNTTIENVIRNSKKILGFCDRSDIPIYKGASEALIPGPPGVIFNGADGMGDIQPLDESTPISDIVQEKHAIQAIRDIVLENPKKVTLLCLGPLTNLALALKTYTEIQDNIKEVFVMGGNVSGCGNATRCAEYNFYADPESAHIVLESAKCPVTIVPWEPCMQENIVGVSMEWRLNTVGIIKNEFVEYLTLAERACYKDYINWAVCDAFCMAAFLYPKCILKQRKFHATIELSGKHTRGQVVLDHLKENPENVTVIDSLCSVQLKEILLSAANFD